LLVLLHASVAFAVLHTFLHAPQLLVLLMSVSQPVATFPSQSAWPESHLILHAEATQVPVPPAWLHLLPQLPQLLASSVRLTSQPFAALPSQSLKPGLHAEMAHFEDAHAGVPLAAAHALPHPAQFFTSVAVLTSHPFAGLPSQSAVLATVHFETSQVELLQASTEPVAAHACPHDPQLFVSVAMWSSQPSEAFLLQSP